MDLGQHFCTQSCGNKDPLSLEDDAFMDSQFLSKVPELCDAGFAVLARFWPAVVDGGDQGLQLRVSCCGLLQLPHLLVTDRQVSDDGMDLHVKVLCAVVLGQGWTTLPGQRVGDRDALARNVGIFRLYF